MAKLLSFILMVVFVFSLAQPIFAEPHFGDTRIMGVDGTPLKNITVSPGTSIELHSRLYWCFWPYDRDNIFEWIPQTCRYLNFNVYKANPDGSNGELVWSGSSMTNWFSGNANPEKFTLNESGNYNLVVKYEGKLKPCNATAKIFVEPLKSYKLGDTKITGSDREPLNDIHVRDGDLIQLQARCSVYDHICNENTSMKYCWVDKMGLYLHFYVYKTTPDGTNGDLVWDNSAMTNLVTLNANPDKFALTADDSYNGTYNLVVKYEGSIARKCNSTSKIFVEPRKNVMLGDTKILGKDGEPLNDITVQSGDPIELQAKLYLYEDGTNLEGYHRPRWHPLPWYYLDFYVYRTNPDGTNGELVWSDTAMTNAFTLNANPDKFNLTQKGCYNLVVKYDGKMNHCRTTAKIYIV